MCSSDLVLPEHVAADPALRQRFEREARTLAALSHPHICPVFDIGSQDGVDFLVMEYLEGETLAERLQRGALPLEQALQIAIQITDALDKAHRSGIVHRDLKPGNIMLVRSGSSRRAASTKPHAKLLDFGLARPVTRFTVNLPPTQRFPPLDDSVLAISPDGTRLAYVAIEGGVQTLYLRTMDDAKARPVPGTEGGTVPFFSPDSRWLGFFAGGKLKKISVNGGAAVALCDAPGNTIRAATWSAEETIVFQYGGSNGFL